MRVAEIIDGMPVRRSSETDPEVTGITFNSRQVKPGDLFVALTGQQFDGRAFVSDALERGAVAGEKLKGEQLRFLLAGLVIAVCVKMAWGLIGTPDELYSIAPVLGVPQ